MFWGDGEHLPLSTLRDSCVSHTQAARAKMAVPQAIPSSVERRRHRPGLSPELPVGPPALWGSGPQRGFARLQSLSGISRCHCLLKLYLSRALFVDREPTLLSAAALHLGAPNTLPDGHARQARFLGRPH